MLLLLFGVVGAQSYVDEALRFSVMRPYGSARTAGAGNAFGAVGADLGALAVNPAAAGIYRSSDYNMTFGLGLLNTESTIDNNITNRNWSRVNLPQAGAVWARIMKSSNSNSISFNPNVLKTLSFGIHYQRLQSFAFRDLYESNVPVSMVQSFAERWNNTKLPLGPENYPIEMVLASDIGLMNFDTINGLFNSLVNGPVLMNGNTQTSGGADNIAFTLGGNIDDRFYFGVNFDLPIMTYVRRSTYNEVKFNDTLNGFRNMNIESNLRVSGFGFSGSLGAIYRPVPWMRFGLAYHLPRFYRLDENYSLDYSAETNATGYSIVSAQFQPFRYRFRTPMKGVLSVAAFLKQHGFISVDYEFLNAASGRYNFGNDFQSFTTQVNTDIKSRYRFVHQLRFGIEGAVKQFRLRAGSVLLTSAHNNRPELKKPSYAITAGAGYRGRKIYIDLAYIFEQSTGAATLFEASDYKAAVRQNIYNNRIMLTLGYRIPSRL